MYKLFSCMMTKVDQYKLKKNKSNQPAEPEYEAWWRVSEANESQTSYSV
jgi:hypothetical protein